jgi:Trypsin-co-occurring domain 1
MAAYLRFQSGEATILVEMDDSHPVSGEQEAGLGQWARDRAAAAAAATQAGFEEAVRQAINLSIPAFLSAADALDRPPNDIEVAFGLKATGEVGNLAVGKAASECNFQIKMAWKRADVSSPRNEDDGSGGRSAQPTPAEKGG